MRILSADVLQPAAASAADRRACVDGLVHNLDSGEYYTNAKPPQTKFYESLKHCKLTSW